MVRRWSCVINVSKSFSNFDKFTKIHKISLFKTSVNFKRFTFKFTKFKRHSLIRFKHKSLFLLYNNIFKYWVKDFMFNKLYLKYQFFNQIFINNFFFYNFNFIKSKSTLFFYNFNFIFTTLSNKKFFYFYNKTSLIKNSPLTVAWFFDNPIIDTSVVPVFTNFQNSYFLSTNIINMDFNLNNIFNLFFDIFIKKNTTIRHIITLLMFHKINLKS